MPDTSLNQALALLDQSLPLCQTQEVAIEDAGGCILREAIAADRDMPPFDRVIMDGIALKAESLASTNTLTIQATQGAGQAALTLESPADHCIQIMTGAVLPHRCDCVIPYEEIDIADQQVTIREPAAHKARQCIHTQGSDCPQGTTLLKPGIRLRGPQIALIAGTGKNRVLVSRPPKLALISNGDELIEPGIPVELHQIRPSSTYGLLSMCKALGCTDSQRFHLPDDPVVIEQKLKELLRDYDLLVMSGGVSKGAFDYVPKCLQNLGVTETMHRVQMRPGRPFWFGKTADGKPVFALPGNPASTMVCFQRLVVPQLRRALGLPDAEPQFAMLAEDLQVPTSLTFFQAVTVRENEQGQREAMPVACNSSGDYASLSQSDGLLELDAGTTEFKKGQTVPYHPWL